MIKNYRKLIDKKLTELELKKKDILRYTAELEILTDDAVLLDQAKGIFKKASLITQNHLAKHLESIVTKAIQAVFFEKEVYFKVGFVERRAGIECDMWLEENGHEYEILSSRGYGMADIVSFALRVAYILLHSSDNILIIDEPARNLDKDKHAFASQMIKTLSKELNMQFIMGTHSEDFISHADKAFHVIQDSKGVSSVKLV
jgi:DNA repair exonuclease SbcCD ATPase subunit